MVASLTVIGGQSGSVLTGLVSVPSALPSDINAVLQTLLTDASGAATAGTAGYENFNVAALAVFSSTVVGTNNTFEITNTDSLGAQTDGTFSASPTVSGSFSSLIVQAPGDYSVTGNGITSIALFGANSNVDYTVLSGSGSIYAAGGNDSITLGDASDSPSYTIYSSGNDTVNLISGSSSILATGNSSTSLLLGAAAATVTSADNSTVSVVFQPRTAGSLDFINNSSGAATVYTGAYTLPGGGNQYATNAVTAFGGAGGGFYVGGLAGGNSLVGGSGVVTLQGGGNNDVLSVTGGSGNVLFSGPSAETLGAGAGTGDNTFQLNLKYVGIGTITGADVVSSQGSGQQAYLLGAGDSTITGSTVAGASNVFDLVRDASIGSANYTLTNFASMSSANFFITGGSGVTVADSTTGSFGGKEVTTLTLSDQTMIKFDGLSTANLSVSTDTTNGVISISYHS